jgi:Flp pilus assembly protein TadD
LVSYSKLGDLLARLGETAAARRHFEQAREIAERLVDLDPGNASRLRDLSVSHQRLGDLLATLGETAAAGGHFEQAREIRERLVALDPENVQFQTDLAASLVRMGDPGSLERALSILRRLQQENRLAPREAAWIGLIKTALGKGAAG